MAIPKGFFPTEDIGQITGSTVGPDDASFDAMVARQRRWPRSSGATRTLSR